MICWAFERNKVIQKKNLNLIHITQSKPLSSIPDYVDTW